MRDIFPNLYRQTGNSASSTSVEATVGRVRSGVSSVLHSLEPGASPQGTATTNVVASTSTYMSLPMRRAPPYPCFNQRQTYHGSSSYCRTQRVSRSRVTIPTSSGRKFNRTVVLVDSSYEILPRGRARQLLHEKGLVYTLENGCPRK